MTARMCTAILCRSRMKNVATGAVGTCFDFKNEERAAILIKVLCVCPEKHFTCILVIPLFYLS